MVLKKLLIALVGLATPLGASAAPAPPDTHPINDRVIVTAELTVEQKIADLYQRIAMSAYDANGKLYLAKTQAEAGIASAVIMYGDGKHKNLPVWVLGMEMGAYKSKGDVVFAFTCAKNGYGKNDIARITIREAIVGDEIQKRCGVASFGSGPVRYEYISAYWTALIQEMFPNQPTELQKFAELINYRPYAKKAHDRIEASDDHNNIADAGNDPDHGTAGMITSSRPAWTY